MVCGDGEVGALAAEPTPQGRAVAELSELLGGQAAGFDPAAIATGFSTDNRQISPGDLFIAIKGARADGHDFVVEAMAAGAVGAIVERPVSVPHILVRNVVESLADMGGALRARFTCPVVGITGSSGKTSTKELLAAALSPLGEILKSEGNRNTEYTSPLIWASDAAKDAKAAVVEMAMRGPGQIAHLAGVHKPTVGIVTNIGYSHLEQLGSREAIADAKGELAAALPADGTAIFWSEDPFLDRLRARTKARVLTFGDSDEADCQIEVYRSVSWAESWIKGKCLGEPFEAVLPTIGRHQGLNASAAVLAARVAGVGVTQASAALALAQLPPMRMESFSLNGARVLLDTYNASPPAMVSAIETFADLPCMGRRFAVLGEMKELGSETIEAHRKIGRALIKANLYKVLFYGAPMTFARQELIRAGAPSDRLPFATSLKDVREFLEIELAQGDCVLIKGSRALELEKALPEQVPGR